MFGRVSTAPIPESFSHAYHAYLGEGGVYLGKKFTDAYADEANFGEFPPILSGWVDWNQSQRKRTYPEYAMPKDLPPWIAVTNAKRYLIGADSLLGPFSFADAVYLRSVVKEIKNEVGTITFTCTGTNGASATTDSSNGSFIKENYSDEINTSIPLTLFNHDAKDYENWHSNNSKTWPSFSPFTTGSTAGCRLDVQVGSFNAGYSIVMDVDNYSEYYVEIPYFAYSAVAHFGANETKKEETENPVDPPRYVSASTGGTKNCYLYVGKRKFLGRIMLLGSEPDMTESLSSEGQTMSKTFGADTEFKKSVTYISGSLEYTFKGVTKTIKLSGLEYEDHTNYMFSGFGQGRMPYSTVNSIAPASPLKSTAVGFWPYKNADGEPVYNTSTGAFANDPIP